MNIQPVFFLKEIQGFSESALQFCQALSRRLPLLILADSDSMGGKVNLENVVYKSYDDILKGLKELCLSNDWVLLFSNRDIALGVENFVRIPLPFWTAIDAVNQHSFTNHAKKKLIYNQLSSLYMDSIGNDTDKETNFLEKCFKKATAKTILDCCCGVGRHDYLLGQDGYTVTGIDFSASQIATAKRIHQHANVQYLVDDVRSFDLAKKDYDGAMCMWTTYNYFSKDQDFLAFMRNIWRHLKKGGILVLDSKNIPALDKVRFYGRTSQHDDLTLNLLIYKRILGNIQNSQYFYFLNQNGKKNFYLDEEFIRFYYLQELVTLMGQGGMFEFISAFGDFDGNPYGEKQSERMITVWRSMKEG